MKRPDLREAALWAIRRFLKVPVEARTGPIRHRARHREAVRATPPLAEAIRALDTRFAPRAAAPGASPVFVLSAGWRSGSTLLQRLVMSAGGIVVWGEPYDRLWYVQRLAESLRALGGDWPPDRFFLDARERDGATDHSGEWVANLYPEVADLQAAHRAFFDRLFAEPARARGYERWGVKEVRLSAGHATYLRWLYPDAKILFLVRDPLAAYRSYRIFRPWYDRWPEPPVFTPGDFGRHWARLAGSFAERADDLDARLIRFEDLVGGRTDLETLSEYLGLELRPEVLEKPVTGRGGAELAEVPAVEYRLLRRVVGPVARELGYDLAG